MQGVTQWQRPSVILLVGALLGFLAAISYDTYVGVGPLFVQDCGKLFPFTNPNLDCVEQDESARRLKALDAEFEEAIVQYVKAGRAKRVSVWVRDLATLQSTGANEFQTYAPASLMKVPLMIAYFKFAEIQPSLLNQRLLYVPAATQGDSAQDIPPVTPLQVGQQYSVEQLIETMIENSDNDAADILAQKIDPSFFSGVLSDLGIVIPRSSDEHDFVTAKTNANIYRVLFNASYLNRQYSEKALSILSKTTFGAIRDSLPSGVMVADKFGERQIDGADGSVQTRQLHDCGVVYKQPHPYTICVFTEGSDFDQLKTVIEDISKIAYSSI